MNRNNFILVLILFLGFIGQALSATNVQSDYVITLQRDTVFGSIIVNNLTYSPPSIEFKKEGSSEMQTFLPSQISSFCADNNVFVSKKVSVNVVDTVANSRFLYVYNLGKVSLYSYSSPTAEKVFFIEKNNEIIKLIYSKTEVITDNGRFEKENFKFRGQMASFLTDFPDLIKQINIANYYDRDLMRIVKKYNEEFLNQKSFVSKKDKEKITIQYGLTAGLSVGNLKFTNESRDFDYLINSKYNSISPSFGVNIEYRLPVLNRRLAFYQEIAYLGSKYEDTYKSGNEIDHTLFDLSYLRLYNMLRFTYYRNNVFSAYIGAGHITGLALKKMTKRNNSSTMGGVTITSETDVISSYPPFQYALGACAGVCYKRFKLEYRMDKGTSISAYMFHLDSYQLNQFVNLQYTIN